MVMDIKKFLYLVMLLAECEGEHKYSPLETMMETYKGWSKGMGVKDTTTKTFATGEVKLIGKSKIVSVKCHNNLKSGLASTAAEWTSFFIVWWSAKHSKPSDDFKMIGGAGLLDYDKMGLTNIRWQPRSDLIKEVKPHILCAAENQGGEHQLKMKHKRNNYLQMYFIMDECDSPGQFRCEAVVKLFGKIYPIYAYFNADKAQDGGVSSKSLLVRDQRSLCDSKVSVWPFDSYIAVHLSV
ncbi:uncharacterized protein LOC134261652 [Saccostrea cucullata]|uniref:uncharacterized protein LOC134261652 n=1 Tax=Saccostrea cuccullata TaxID=36930 RepID=UPI002ED16C26